MATWDTQRLREAAAGHKRHQKRLDEAVPDMAAPSLSRERWRQLPRRAPRDQATSQRIVALAHERQRFGYRLPAAGSGSRIKDRRVRRLRKRPTCRCASAAAARACSPNARRCALARPSTRSGAGTSSASARPAAGASGVRRAAVAAPHRHTLCTVRR